MNLSHAAFEVKDMDRSVEFYCDALGFKDAFDNPSVIYLLGEKLNGSRSCIKLSLQDSLYSDITATKGSKMNVEFSCIDRAKKLSTSSYIVNKVED